MKPGPNPHRQTLTFLPIIDFVRLHYQATMYDVWSEERHRHEPSDTRLSRLLDCHTSILGKYRRDNVIPLVQADRFACKKLHVHPALIWGHEYYRLAYDPYLMLDDRQKTLLKWHRRKHGPEAKTQDYQLAQLAAVTTLRQYTTVS